MPDELSPLPLGAFARRVRLARAWRGAAWGLGAGAAIGTAWATADLFRAAFVEPIGVAILAGAGAAIGLVAGACRPVGTRDLAISVDRRGHLLDRLTTAGEGGGEFDLLLAEDAARHAKGLSPRALYPLRFGRIQIGALSLLALACVLTLAAVRPEIFLPSKRGEVAAAKERAKAVERVLAKAVAPEAAPNDETRRLVAQAMRLQKEIERGRLNKEESIERGKQLLDEAKRMTERAAEKGLEALDKADEAAAKLAKAQAEKATGEKMSAQDFPKTLEEATAKAEASRAKAEAAESAAKEAERALDKAKADVARAEEALRNAKTDGERAAAQKALDAAKAAQRAAEDAQKAAQKASEQAAAQVKLSEAAQKAFADLQNDPAFKKLQEMAKKLRQAAQDAKDGKRPKITKEELEEMRKQAEELAKQLKDPEFRKELLKQLKEAIKNGKFGEGNGAMMQELALALGMTSPDGAEGSPSTGPDNDRMVSDSGKVNKLDKGVNGEGKANAAVVNAKRGDGAGPETFVEVRGPSTIGLRTTIPYAAETPVYKERAESALRSGQIPKQHRKRVRDYFTGLGR